MERTLPSIEDRELIAELERALGEYYGAPRRIARLERRPSAYRTSYYLEELDVWCDDGQYLEMIFKDASPAALSELARRAKPPFVLEPRREIEVYRNLLTPHHSSAPLCYGAVADPARERYWLFLERVQGVELYQVGEFELWQAAARWLAQQHSAWRGRASELARLAPLLHYDRVFYEQWLVRATEFLQGTALMPEFEWLAERYPRVVERLLALEPTFIHGEFYASNVLVQRTSENVRVAPLDWEMAAIGPGLIDLAALTSGKWNRAQREQFAHAYYDALPNADTIQFSKMLEDLQYCRMHVAMQWMGWTRDWAPPHTQSSNWMREALDAAHELGWR